MKDGNNSCIMEFMTVNEVEDALKRTKTAILPIGVIEQHGYHLPLNTDVYNAYELGKRAAEKAKCLVAPPIIYSYSGGELAGTTDINPSLLALLVDDICKSLVNQGFINIILLLGHAGTENMKATRDAADMFLRRNPQFDQVVMAVVPFAELSSSINQAFKDKDFHAGYLETSLMLYWHPELVREKYVTDSDDLMKLFREDQDAYQLKEKPVENKFVIPRTKQNPRMKVGVMGDPSKASVDFGRKVVKECVENLVKLVDELEARK